MQFARRRVYVPSSYTSLGRTHLSLIAALSGINDTSDCLNECAGTRQNTLRRRHTHTLLCSKMYLSLSYIHMRSLLGISFLWTLGDTCAGRMFHAHKSFNLPRTQLISGPAADANCTIFWMGCNLKGAHSSMWQHQVPPRHIRQYALIQNIGYRNVYNLSKLFMDDLLYLLYSSLDQRAFQFFFKFTIKKLQPF